MAHIILRRTVFLTLSLCLVAVLHGQSYKVSFAYDATGNRTERIITLSREEEDTLSREDTVLPADVFALESEFFTDGFTDAEVRLYPNPTHSLVTVDGIGGNGIECILRTSTGIVVSRSDLHGTTYTFDLSGFAPGLYLLELRRQDETRVWKVIKK